MFQILNRKIGIQYSPYIIAELSANHNGVLERAKISIKAAKDAGLRIDISVPTPKVPSMSKALDIYIEKANKK